MKKVEFKLFRRKGKINRTDSTEKPKKHKIKFDLKMIKDLRIKNGLFRRLILTFTLLSLVTLTLSGALIYAITKQKVTSDFQASTLQILDQNKNYISLVDSSIEATSMQLVANKDFNDGLTINTNDTYTKYSTKLNLENVLSNLTASGTAGFIKSIYVFNDNGMDVNSDSSNSDLSDTDKLTAFKSSDDYKEAITLDGKTFWTNVHQNTFATSNESVISLMRVLKNVNNFKTSGVMVINVDPSILASSIKDAKIGKDGYILMVDNNGNIISDKNGSDLGKKLDASNWNAIKDKTEGTFDFNSNGKKLFGVYTTYDVRGWKLIAVVPKNELSTTADNIGMLIILIILVCLLLTIIFSFFTTGHVTSPINDIIEITDKVSHGDFTVASKQYSLHEINELSINFNRMIEELKNMLSLTSSLALDTSNSSSHLAELSQNINTTSKEVVRAVEEITSGSSKQTEETINCARISDKFNEEITKAISSLANVNSATENSINVISDSSTTILTLNNTSANNSSAMNEVAETISDLNSNTREILTILNKINNITKQTNLLALNASIEAARAGDAGKGFSVVANEIRKLADQSQSASQEIENIISHVNTSINASLKISQNAQELFKEELLQVSNTIASFTEIRNSIEKISSAMNLTMDSIKIIDNDKNYLNDSINSIAAISEENTASTEEVTASIHHQYQANSEMYSLAEGLNLKADELKNLIEKFKF